MELTPEQARGFLVGHHGLRRVVHPPGARGVRALLAKLRCIQLDPLDVLGTNADLVALARLDGIARGDVYRHVFPGHAFEHFAKERCLLPASAFPWYRERAIETPWYRTGERVKRLPPALIQSVLDEVRERGPIAPDALSDRGSVAPLDWSGWKGTGRATSMALEVLATRCQVVVVGRTRTGKLYDVPERALKAGPQAVGNFERWALIERVEAAGLLSRAGGATWSMLAAARTSGLPDQLVAEGVLEDVTIAGRTRRYLAPAGFRRRRFPAADGRVRILGPLDPLLWDRELVRHAFDFDYVWEVYKPAAQRRWGWYVCPLLQGDRLVGRIDAAVDAARGALVIRKLWREPGAALDPAALDQALERHARACGVSRVIGPRRVRSPAAGARVSRG